MIVVGPRVSKNDLADIAKNLSYKEVNIEKVKNHVFKNKHYFDRLFSLEPGKRLQSGTYTEKDKIWLMHEYAEQYHERTHDSGYSEAYDRAEKRFNGAPWKNNY